MSTHVPGFRSFFGFFASFCIGKTSSIRVKVILSIITKIMYCGDNNQNDIL